MKGLWRLLAARFRPAKPEHPCAWCPDALSREYTRRWFADDSPVSHGMCSRCQERMEAEYLAAHPVTSQGVSK